MGSSRECLPEIRSAARPVATVALIALGDLLALSLSGLGAIYGYLLLGGRYPPPLYLSLWPCLILFLLVYELSGLYHGSVLYPGMGLEGPEELRRLVLATTTAYVLLGSATFLSKSGPVFSRGVFLLAWATSVLLVPCSRLLQRRLCSEYDWWGVPCLLFGSGAPLDRLVAALADRPHVGLRPAGIVSVDGSETRESVQGVPVFRCPSDDQIRGLARQVGYAIPAFPEFGRDRILTFVEGPGKHFRHVLLIPTSFEAAGLWITVGEVGTHLALEVRQNLLLPVPRAVKRSTDVVLAAALGLVLMPVWGLLALAVRLTSGSPVLYRQRRVGINGGEFEMLKFRTMVADGPDVLDRHLADNPAARAEWDETRKLKADPRVTPVGRFLRRSSLDELPQLWNVLRGEMSLVGPRPIVRDEIPLYGDVYGLYARIRPGITGLWQVSGRNRLTFAERVRLDAYYVRKWSLWLDLYILVRTPRAVVSGEGAY